MIRVLLVLAASLIALHARAQAYPTKSVQMLLGFSAGGSVDIMARGVAEEMSALLGQRLLVVNREGASGVVAMSTVAAATPDGYTLAIGPATPLTNVPHAQKNLSYSLDSFQYVCQTFRNDFTLAVKADAPYSTLEDLLEAIRRSPGKLSYGHAGTASIPHLAVVDLLQKRGLQALDVPFKGDAAMLPALLGGTVDFGAPSVLSVAGQRDRVRVLSVFGPPNQGLNGIYAPKNVPREIVSRLEAACESAVKSEKLADLAKRYQSTPEYLGSAAFERIVREDYERKGALIRTLPDFATR
jgi:tripartite-type tricarboxylate transporter receptor subunit TctC